MTLLPLLLLLAYAPDGRKMYLSEAIEALRAADPAKVGDASNYLRTMDRNKCRSAFRRLRVQCLIEAAARNCRSLKEDDKRQGCSLYSDIIVTTVLAEQELISEDRRFEIMQNNVDYRAAFRAEVRRLYGSLAAGFRLSPHYSCKAGDVACLATAIDAYCIDQADRQSLAWQHCAAGLVWFIGTASRE
jgi:hypothetical protein